MKEAQTVDAIADCTDRQPIHREPFPTRAHPVPHADAVRAAGTISQHAQNRSEPLILHLKRHLLPTPRFDLEWPGKPCCVWRVGASDKLSLLAQEERHVHHHGRPSPPPPRPRPSVLLSNLWHELPAARRQKTLQAIGLLLGQQLEALQTRKEVADEGR